MKSRLMLAAAAGALVATLAILPETAMAQSARSSATPAATAPAKLSQDQIDWVMVYFANDSVLPFHAPDFTRVPDAAYLPAFEQAMADPGVLEDTRKAARSSDMVKGETIERAIAEVYATPADVVAFARRLLDHK